jgi:hypothetical protein
MVVSHPRIVLVWDWFSRIISWVFLITILTWNAAFSILMIYRIQPKIVPAILSIAVIFTAFAAAVMSYSRGFDSVQQSSLNRRGGFILVAGLICGLATFLAHFFVMLGEQFPTEQWLGIVALIIGGLVFIALTISVCNLLFVSHHICFHLQKGYKLEDSISIIEKLWNRWWDVLKIPSKKKPEQITQAFQN